MKHLVLFVFLAVSLNVVAQTESLLGKKSPELTFETIVNFEKTKATLNDFSGKLIILDFWATWCGPCIQSFPELEKLQAKFRNDLQVITITDDPEARIKRFLEKRKTTLPVVIDEKRALAQLFPHRTIPHTVIIDKSGTVRAITTSSEVSEELIKNILAGNAVSVKEKKDVIDFDPSLPLSGNGDFTYQLTMTPFKEGFPSFSNSLGGSPYEGRRIVAVNVSAKTLFEIAHQFPPGIRTALEVTDPSKFSWNNKQNIVCFDLIVPEKLGDKRFELMKQQLEIYFGYQASIEERVRPVKVLQKIKDTGAQLIESKAGTQPSSSYSGKGLSMRASGISTLADFLESQINKPVIDETGLSSLYDLDIPWYNENPKQIHEELKKIGLQIVETERKIQVLVIKDK
ncbi:redoxin domain-containing protein [Runella limosa]|uniref:redoxin domain-containing protein n=1 Tax=Runella limosa TaxID=370978 RepID=UPI0004077127|nr:redoxin domain-containing protein [Runella limosa]